MSEIKSELESFILRVIKPAKKELKIIRENDWTAGETVKIRDSKYALQRMLTDRAISNMKKLYHMAEKRDEVKKAKVKNALKILRQFYTILDERYTRYTDDVSWMIIEDHGNVKAVKRQEDEARLQSLVLTDINKFEEILRSINDGEESNEIHIEMHGKQPLPLMMEEASIVRFPQIKEFLKQKSEDV